MLPAIPAIVFILQCNLLFSTFFCVLYSTRHTNIHTCTYETVLIGTLQLCPFDWQLTNKIGSKKGWRTATTNKIKYKKLSYPHHQCLQLYLVFCCCCCYFFYFIVAHFNQPVSDNERWTTQRDQSQLPASKKTDHPSSIHIRSVCITLSVRVCVCVCVSVCVSANGHYSASVPIGIGRWPGNSILCHSTESYTWSSSHNE